MAPSYEAPSNERKQTPESRAANDGVIWEPGEQTPEFMFLFLFPGVGNRIELNNSVVHAG